MKSKVNGIYYIVDDKFISNFKSNHIEYMKDFYYKKYIEYCERAKRDVLKKEIFFTNMRRRRVKIFQICCPYCGNMHVLVFEEKIGNLNYFKYCYNCGKSSVSYNVFSQLSSFARIRHFHSVGLKTMEVIHNEDEIQSLTYEVFHLELVQLTSILEVILRDFFESFIYTNYIGAREIYISKLVNKNIGNDFMNIEKANNHYKKALDINLRAAIDDDTWFGLIDLVNIRNTIVHNNGMVDGKFKNTKTYSRVQECIDGELIFISKKIVNKYYSQVKKVADIIGNLFEERYSIKKYDLIANYYFNQQDRVTDEED